MITEFERGRAQEKFEQKVAEVIAHYTKPRPTNEAVVQVLKDEFLKLKKYPPHLTTQELEAHVFLAIAEVKLVEHARRINGKEEETETT